ncbi:MAG: hypothetical protein WAV31_03505 [Candidatus Moraniibacteriota bacterium]
MIGFGTVVLTYNQWTGYDNYAVCNYYRPATEDEIRNLKPGNAIWINEDPLHPRGKVYGFVKKKVNRVEGNKVYFGNGFTTFHDSIFFVEDETALEKLIATDPRMTDIIGDSGRAATKIIEKLGLSEKRMKK